MKTVISTKLILFGIFILAAFLRFYDLNWDQGFHLHPDERFLTMVGNAMKMSSSLSQYLNPGVSSFNPANIGYRFFVYGAFPLILNKIFAVILIADNYNDFTLLGRALSALADLLVVFFIFKTAELLEKQYKYPHALKFFAAFFYAIAVLPIQLSHFFAVDTFLNLFVFASFYFILRFYSSRSIFSLLLGSLSLGLALSSKVSAIFILPLLLFLIFYLSKKHYAFLILCLFIFGIVTYTTVRFANPYYFETENIFSPQISKLFLENIQQLKSWEGKDVWYPPAIQWINKQPVITSLNNLVLFGIGIPYFVFVIYGLYLVFLNYKRPIIVSAAIWVLLFFLYQSIQFVKVMRYFIIIYPFLAIFAAIGFSSLTKRLNLFVQVILIILLLAWPLAFMSIYISINSRVEASYWIYQNLPSGSRLASEEWDDSLPLGVQNPVKQFYGDVLPVFASDTPQKWRKIDEILNRMDYYILSSNRAWGSIPTVPQKYPIMTKFYSDLFAGKLQYKKIKEFTSYPSLKYLGIPLEFPDDWAEESFTVFDHPKVIIFKRI